MVSIQVGGEDKTAEIVNWLIWSDKRAGLQLICSYLNKGPVLHALKDCVIVPTRELNDVLLTRSGSTNVTPVAKATIYGERYAVVHYPGAADKPYVFKMEGIDFIAPMVKNGAPVLQYFIRVAKARQAHATSQTDSKIAANVVDQLGRLPVSVETALHAYCTGHNGTLLPGPGLIYPFGLNESQLAAVEHAFRAQVSVIEGRPGRARPRRFSTSLPTSCCVGKQWRCCPTPMQQ
ncbi:hypothetical protein NG829_10115 [Xanthomonas sacchari]|uniref:hypothetical protein n=1 Tax=Xanthomonas sacchari TaxID=56458 RepID=UPI00225E2245|nr:hypothetical protein [Xanthomonas sacchari]UYK82620.1 hypothetical protein NG829_10115 [Xanthomonas sacchari]